MEERSTGPAVSIAVPAADQVGDDGKREQELRMSHQNRSERPGLGPRRGGKRYVTGLAQHWVSPHKDLLEVEAKYGKGSWQAHAFRVIHTHKVQSVFMMLLLLDVIILFVELYLDAQYPSCHFIQRDGINCCAATEGEDHGNQRGLLDRLLSADDSHHHTFCESPLVEADGEVGCNSHEYPAVHTAHTVLFSLTILILSVFLIELLVLLWILGAPKFFSHRLYMLDFVIVVTSMTLEISFRAISEDDIYSTLAGLLIIGRVWRFVRIGHGLFATTLEVSLHKVEELETQIEELKMLLEESSGARVNLPNHVEGNHH